MARSKQAVIIGGGFAGLSAACYMARAGYRVVLLEKNKKIGGRAQAAQDAGFKFDLGPNWYIMPDLYEDFFQDFGTSPEDHYKLIRLSPAFRTFTPEGEYFDALEPEHMADQLDSFNHGDGIGFKRLLNRSKVVYSRFKLGLMQEDWLSKLSKLKPKVSSTIFKLPKGTIASRNAEFIKSRDGKAMADSFSHFLGGTANRTPAAYSFLPYTVFDQGVWYPEGGFSSVVSGFRSLAQKLGVEIYEGYEVEKVEVQYGVASAVVIKDLGERIPADVVISASDYLNSESMLEPIYQSYSLDFWKSKQYSPSAIVVSLGLNQKVPNLLHHNTFTNPSSSDLNIRAWPSQIGTFSVTCPTFTEPNLAPNGGEVLTVTIPIPAGLSDEEAAIKRLISQAYEKISVATGVNIQGAIVTEHIISSSYFKSMFYAPGGSIAGLAQYKDQIFQKDLV
ncbi:MAG: phytoene desaturase [Candidatus Nomurabacteria bacterium]|nr:MAG: phytoene desaturase [Candidatus Nomurabacteria bacterium]